MGFFYGADADTVEFQGGEAGADSEARYVQYAIQKAKSFFHSKFRKPSIFPPQKQLQRRRVDSMVEDKSGEAGFTAHDRFALPSPMAAVAANLFEVRRNARI